MPEKTLAEKLFLKPGRTLAVLNPPLGYPEALMPLPDFARLTPASEPADVLVLFVHSSAELVARFQLTLALLKGSEIFWLVYPKLSGSLKGDLNRERILAYLASLQWKGIFMISLDENWSALRVAPR